MLLPQWSPRSSLPYFHQFHPDNELALGQPVFPSGRHYFPRVLYLATAFLNSDPLSHPPHYSALPVF